MFFERVHGHYRLGLQCLAIPQGNNMEILLMNVTFKNGHVNGHNNETIKNQTKCGDDEDIVNFGVNKIT